MNNQTGKLYNAGTTIGNKVCYDLERRVRKLASQLYAEEPPFTLSPITHLVGNTIKVQDLYDSLVAPEWSILRIHEGDNHFVYDGQLSSDLSRLKTCILNENHDFMMLLFRAELKEQLRLLSFEEAFNSLQEWAVKMLKEIQGGKTILESLTLNPYTVYTVPEPGKRGEISFSDLLLRLAAHKSLVSSESVAAGLFVIMYVMTYHYAALCAKGRVTRENRFDDVNLPREWALDMSSDASTFHLNINACTTILDSLDRAKIKESVTHPITHSALRLANSIVCVDLLTDLQNEAIEGNSRPFFLNRLRCAEVH